MYVLFHVVVSCVCMLLFVVALVFFCLFVCFIVPRLFEEKQGDIVFSFPFFHHSVLPSVLLSSFK